MTDIPATPSPPRELRRWRASRIIAGTAVVILVALGFYLMYRFTNVLFVFFVAVVLATAMRPAVMWMERRHVPQWLGVLLIYLALLGGAVGLIALMAPLLISQGSSVFSELPRYYNESIDQALQTIDNPLLRGIVARLPRQLPQNMMPTQQEQSTAEVVSQGVGYIRSAAWSLMGLIAIGLIAFFWILDREKIVQAGLLLVPTGRRPGARDLWDTLEEKVGAFIRGQALLCLIIGVMSAVAFFAIGVPNALLLSVLAGVFEAVPYVGPILTAVLAIAVTLSQSPEKIWWVVGACLVIQQVENAVLVPRIMDRAVGVNAVVTLLAIAAFGTLLGIGGAIMAIPLAVIIQVLFDRMFQQLQDAPPAEIVGRDDVALLQYKVQDLSQDIRDRIRAHGSEASDMLPEEVYESLVGDIDEMLRSLQTAAHSNPEVRNA